MSSGHAFTKCFRACKSCMGSTHCRFGLMDSLELGRVLGERYRGIRSPAKVKMGVSGCPRNCSESTIKDFGVVAVEGGWDIYIGGNGGSQVYVAKKIAQVKTDDEVVRLSDRFYEYYSRHARYGERSAHFIERVGLKTVADALLNAPEEDLLELEAAFKQTLDNYKDPWDFDVLMTGDAMNKGIKPEVDDGFVQVARVEDVPIGTSQEFVVGNQRVAVFHTRDDQWIAVDGICPHQQGPLIDSIYGNGRLTCPIHSYAFDVKTGACDNPDVGVLRIFSIQVSDGVVRVKL